MDVRGLHDFSKALQRALWGIAVLGLLGAVMFALLPHPVAAIRAGVFTLLVSGSALLLRRPGGLEPVGHLLIGGSLVAMFSSVWEYGLGSAMMPLLPLLGPVATFTGGQRSGTGWTVASLVVLVIAALRSPMADPAVEIGLFICSVCGIVLAAWITISFWRVTRAQADRLSAANDALRVEQQTSQAASQAKSAFLATMSHEIRTPLNAVIGLSELLEGRQLAPTDRDTVRQIQRSGTLLLSLVNDVLDMSQIESGRLPLSLAPFRVQDICAEVVETLSPIADAQGVGLVLSAPEPQPGILVGDAGRLRQVLVNLVSNALKFTPAGEITVTLRSSPVPSGCAVALSVEDTGIGIPVEAQRQIFEAFAQAEHGGSRARRGSGLGLAISARLMALMGGELVLEWSTPGQGSCFSARVCLPPAEALPRVSEAADTLPPGLRLLVVEDEPINRTVVCSMLASLGCEHVVVARHGAEALELVASSPGFDLILMDQQMPVLDGPATARALRADGLQIPIIALTANAFEEDRQTCLGAGMDDFLTKPINKNTLLRALSRHLPAPSSAAALSS